jgi:hypothetical protein
MKEIADVARKRTRVIMENAVAVVITDITDTVWVLAFL